MHLGHWPCHDFPPQQEFRSLDLDDFPFNPLSKMQDSKGRSVNKRARRGARVEEGDVFDLMIRRGMAMAVNNRIDFVKFSPDTRFDPKRRAPSMDEADLKSL